MAWEGRFLFLMGRKIKRIEYGCPRNFEDFYGRSGSEGQKVRVGAVAVYKKDKDD